MQKVIFSSPVEFCSDIEIESAEDGSGIVVTRPGYEDMEIAKSTEAHEAVTLDFNAAGELIGVEILSVPKVRRDEV